MHQFFKMFYVKKYNKKLTYINILLKKHIWSTADDGSNRWCIFNARAQRSACWLIWAWKSIRIQKLLHFSVEDADRGGYRGGILSYLNPAVYNTHLSWLGVSIIYIKSTIIMMLICITHLYNEHFILTICWPVIIIWD
jgi:hypothetical protein